MSRGELKSERGVALAELAFVLPLVLVLLLGMLDFGKAFNEWMNQTHLASEGARLAAVNYCPNPSSDGSGNLTCDWSSPPSPITCGSPNANLCLAEYIDSQTLGELNTGRVGDSYAPAQNRAQVCISYPNGSTTKVGDPVHVTLKVYYHWLNYVTTRLGVGSAGTPLTGSATMRLESKPFSGVPLDQETCYPSAPAGTA
jgi:hypothetical protein